MPHLRISEAASLLGVSDDTVRRLVESGALTATADSPRTLDGAELARYARERAAAALDADRSSARNRFAGLVTDVRTDGVMAQVDLQCGPFRVVSLMSAEAVRDLALEPGSVAIAVIKSTNVIVEKP